MVEEKKLIEEENKLVEEEPKKMIGSFLPPKLQSPEIREDNKADVEKFPMIINTQRAVYDSLIADLRNRIRRVNERNEYLEKFCEEMTNNIKDHNSEAEKEIVELNTNIVDETTKIENLHLKIKAFFEKNNEVMNFHNDKIMQLNEKFETTRINMQSQLKKLKATVNAVEEYKASEVDLREKFDSNEKYLLDKEEEMQKILDEIKLKEKIHKENLKKESYDQILIVSDQFQHILKDTIPQSVQRLMRENIVLENELVRLWNDHIFMEDTKLNDSYRIKGYKDRIKASRKDEKRRMVTIKLQHLILKRLKNVHVKVEDALSKSFQPPNNFEQNYSKLCEKHTVNEFTKDDFRRRKLEKLLHRQNLKRNLVKDFELKSSLALNKCTETLDVLKNAINSVGGIEEKNDDFFNNMSLDQFSYYMLEIIDKFDVKQYLLAVESQETVGLPGEAYAKGDLGFDPENIQLDYEIGETIEKMHSLSVKSALAVLKEIELMTSKVAEEEAKVSESSTSAESTSTEKDVISKESIIGEDRKSISGEFQSIQSVDGDEMEGSYDDYDDWNSLKLLRGSSQNLI